MTADASAINSGSHVVSKKTAEKGAFYKSLIPYIIIILAQFPLLILYYKNLWETRPHYQAFIFGFVALGFFLYQWWPKSEKPVMYRSWFSVFLLGLGLFFAFLATIFVTSWFACFSTICFLGSLLVRVRDEETGRSLLPLVLLLLVFLQPPKDIDFDTVRGDRILITQLQTTSSKISSYFLDILGYKHNLEGNKIQVPKAGEPNGVKPYQVEEACSGVQSFFTLLFVTAVFIVAFKRPWFRAILLLLSAMFWAVIMNTIRIVVIPIADISLGGLDLSEGVPHVIWGYIALIIGALLVLSTDQLLVFLLGPVDADTEGDESLRQRMVKFWNRRVAGEQDNDNARSKRLQPMSDLARKSLWPIAGIMILVFVVQSIDVARSLAKPSVRVRMFDNDPTVRVTDAMAPDTIKNGESTWKKAKYFFEDRKRSSDLGQRSDMWIYMSDRKFSVMTSFDQVFPGWHELTTCYKADGFKMEPNGRVKVNAEIEGADESWPYIQADFVKPTGEHGFLVFSLIDRAGEPYDAPGDWSSFNATLSRIGNRLSHRIRSRLFHGEGYQIQAFVQTPIQLSNADKQAIVDNYLAFREEFRQRFVSGELKVGAKPIQPANESGSTDNASGNDQSQ